MPSMVSTVIVWMMANDAFRFRLLPTPPTLTDSLPVIRNPMRNHTVEMVRNKGERT